MGAAQQQALIAAFGSTGGRIRTHLLAVVLAAFDRLGSWRDDDVSQFVAAVVPIVAGAQRQMTSLTDAYIAAMLGDMLGGAGRPAGIAAFTGAALRGGVDPAEVYARPFKTVWKLLAAGTDFPAALAAGRLRAEQITKTDLQLAKTNAMRGLLASNRHVVGYRRVLTGTRSCGLCVVATTQRYHRENLMPIHPGCVVEGTRVSARGVKAITRRRYSGELIVITTAAGDELTITPKHPVLTEQGWIPADLLGVGDRIVRGSRLKGMGLGSPGEDHRPAPIEDVRRSLSMLPVVRMPVASEDFHGDGADGEVDVVYVDGGLHSVFASSIFQVASELEFVARHDVGSFFQRRGSAAPLVPACGSPEGGSVCGGGLCAPLFGGHVPGPNLPGLRPTATVNTLAVERLLHRTAVNSVLGGEGVLGDSGRVFGGDLFGGEFAPGAATARFDPAGAEFLGEGLVVYADQGRSLLDRLSGQVELDSLIDVRRIDTTSSHVYNLHTAEGWYSADGVIVSNCDCNVAPIVGDHDPGHVINEPLLEGAHAAIQERFGTSDRSARIPDYRDVLVTHEHGELGPILARRGDAFMGPSDLH